MSCALTSASPRTWLANDHFTSPTRLFPARGAVLEPSTQWPSRGEVRLSRARRRDERRTEMGIRWTRAAEGWA